MTKRPLKVLIADSNTEGRARLVRTLLRKYAKAVVVECPEPEKAPSLAVAHGVEMLVLHHTWDIDLQKILTAVRGASPTLPILILSTQEVAAAATVAHTRVLDYEQWLIAGNVVEEMLRSVAR